MATKKTPKKSAVKKSAKKTAAKKTAVKKTVKKAAAKKTAVTKTAAKKKTAAKTTAKKAVARKAPAPKTISEKTEKKKKLTPREKRIMLIRDKLIEQKNELLQEAESAINTLPEQTVFPDLGDQASAETDRNFMLRLKGREQRLLNKIEEALERIENGVYGICDSCGDEIGIPRLEARPVTTLCIECKTEQEEEEKLQGT